MKRLPIALIVVGLPTLLICVRAAKQAGPAGASIAATIELPPPDRGAEPAMAASNVAASENRLLAAPTGADDDPSWRSLKRVRADLLATMLHTQRCDPVELLRSCSFNPRDTWLNPVARAEITRIATAGGARLDALRAAALAIREREFRALQAAGRLAALDLETLQGQADLQRAGSTPVFAEVDGRMFVAALGDLPDTAAATAALRDATADLCVELTSRFAKFGALEPAEVQAIADAVQASR